LIVKIQHPSKPIFRTKKSQLLTALAFFLCVVVSQYAGGVRFVW
jgi:hypothetical protein